jgi:hypothetical protein
MILKIQSRAPFILLISFRNLLKPAGVVASKRQNFSVAGLF